MISRNFNCLTIEHWYGCKLLVVPCISFVLLFVSPIEALLDSYSWYNVVIKVVDNLPVHYTECPLRGLLVSDPDNHVGLHLILYKPPGSKVRYSNFVVSLSRGIIASPPSISGSIFMPPPSRTWTNLLYWHGENMIFREFKSNSKVEVLVRLYYLLLLPNFHYCMCLRF